ncbi:hypothetical protein HYPSUDRAFT_226822 [Hypholoma sublateritium FD-334 SS-4]|uniref:Uncharacterized protein n=1 Tax=Hypholoma sublateritium (strain FD-334 SS-4) TaxID=945553 RepID=A0A0D2QDI3_HYPSF|nr:hypothetical protein HYPSUDRAFT_226822 [Hypholoma sublateritium FD-334 SS-4]
MKFFADLERAKRIYRRHVIPKYPDTHPPSQTPRQARSRNAPKKLRAGPYIAHMHLLSLAPEIPLQRPHIKNGAGCACRGRFASFAYTPIYL